MAQGKNFAYLRQGYNEEVFMMLSRYSCSFFDEKRSHPISKGESGFGIADNVAGFANDVAGFGIADDFEDWAHDDLEKQFSNCEEEEEKDTKIFRQTKVELSLIQSCINKYQQDGYC